MDLKTFRNKIFSRMLLGGDHRPEEELHVPQWLPYETEGIGRPTVTTE